MRIDELAKAAEAVGDEQWHSDGTGTIYLCDVDPFNGPAEDGQEVAEIYLRTDGKDEARQIFVAAANPATVLELVRRLRKANHRADVLAETIRALSGIVTTSHESKEAFIARVRFVLSGDPEQRLKESRCTWSLPTLPDALAGIWHSSCGDVWSFIDGGPLENKVRYCQGCGKPVDVQPYVAAQEAKSGD